MKNFVSDGNVIFHVLTAAVSSGDLVLAGSLVGVAVTDGAIGEEIALTVEGVFDIPAATGATYALGVKVGFDISANEAIATGDGASDGNVGVCTEAKASGHLVVRIKLAQGL